MKQLILIALLLFAWPVQAMNRDLHWIADASVSTYTNIGGDKLDLTVTDAIAGERYLLFFNAVAGNTGGTPPYALSFSSTQGTDIQLWVYSITPKNNADFYSLAGAFEIGPLVDQNVTALINVSDLMSGGGATLDVKQAAIAMFLRDDLDGVKTDSFVSTTNTSFVALSTLTLEVPTAGDYYIYAVASSRKSVTTSNYSLRLTVDGTSVSDASMRSPDVGDTLPWSALYKATLAAGTKTITVDGKVTSAGTLTAEEITIYAIRADRFPASWYSESRGATTITATYPSFQTKLSQTLRSPTDDLLVLTSAPFITTVGNTVYGLSQYDGTDMQQSSATAVGGGDETAHSGLYPLTPTVGDRTVTIKAAKSGGLGITISDAAILTLRLKDNATLYDYGGQVLGGEIY